MNLATVSVPMDLDSDTLLPELADLLTTQINSAASSGHQTTTLELLTLLGATSMHPPEPPRRTIRGILDEAWDRLGEYARANRITRGAALTRAIMKLLKEKP